MEREKKDRRTRKTRQILRSALLALLKEKRYEDISVQDIIERADVARSTFYVHYVDKDDLLMGRQGIFASNLGHEAGSMARVDEKDHVIFSSRDWFYHIQAQNHILTLIARDPAMDLAMKTLHGIIQRDVQEKVQQRLKIGEDAVVPSSLIVDYLSGSLMVLLKWWLREGMPYTPEQMDEFFQQLVMPGVSSIIENRIT